MRWSRLGLKLNEARGVNSLKVFSPLKFEVVARTNGVPPNAAEVPNLVWRRTLARRSSWV